MSGERQATREPVSTSAAQRLMDNVPLLLAAGLVIPTVIYIIFGIMSLVGVPAF